MFHIEKIDKNDKVRNLWLSYGTEESAIKKAHKKKKLDSSCNYRVIHIDNDSECIYETGYYFENNEKEQTKKLLELQSPSSSSPR